MRSSLSVVSAALAVALASGCYLAHELDAPIAPGPCDASPPPRCITVASDCEPRSRATAECVGDRWSCPAGSEVYEPTWADDVCLPLARELDLFLDGVHEAPLPVAIAGECRWLVPLSSPEGPTYVAARRGRACGDVALVSRESVVTDSVPSSYVGMQASFADARGEVRVLVRGWQFDAFAPFGVRDLGVGLGRVEGERVVAPASWLFDPSVDLGDAAVVEDGWLYAYGCPGIPDWIEEDCNVGRAELDAIDHSDAWELFGEGGWGVGGPARVFGSGPHRGPVFRDPRGRGFAHVYAVGFGRTIEIARSERPEGPWSSAATLVPCDLPASDPGAYCAGPVVFFDLWDPFEPDELVVGYSIGTTSSDGDALRRASPEAYWPRLVRVRY